jgi:threonine synthase
LKVAEPWKGVIAEFADRLPLPAGAPNITLGEGGTPLVHSPWLSGLTGGQVHVKVEGSNPTGSFKDRGMTVAISNAVAEGAKAVVCASTGNTSASMAAYAARAGLAPIVLVPHGRIAAGKMAQAVMFGAEIIQIEGGFDECLNIARGLADDYPVSLVNSLNPMRLQGQKTAAFEIVTQLGGQSPDLHVMPVGNAGNISAYWMGFKELQVAPRLWGFQAAGAAPFVAGHPIADPETVASAIRIGNPASWDLAVAARDESGGRIAAVTDEQILSAQRALASHDGIFVEPASAAGVAGLIAAAERGEVESGLTISVTVTGNGLKDIETALSGIDSIVDSVIEADVHAAARAAGLA